MRAIRVLQRCFSDCRGATAVEYGLIVALVVIGVIASIQSVADENTRLWDLVSDEVTANIGD
jgi:pilus assembly protein Flp/PilA